VTEAAMPTNSAGELLPGVHATINLRRLTVPSATAMILAPPTMVIVVPATVISMVATIIIAMLITMIPTPVVHRLWCGLCINRCAERQADIQIRMSLRDTACARSESSSNQQVSDDAFHVVLL
jgi:hypothetical protein